LKILLSPLFFRRSFRVKENGLRILPRPGILAPSPWIAALGLLVKDFLGLEDFRMLSPVTLPRSDEPYGAVMVSFVVPMHEILSPEPRGFKVFETLSGKDGPVFVGPEEGFRVGIVVAYPGPGPAGNDAQGSAGFQEGGSFHGAPVVRVEYQRCVAYLLGEHHPGYEFCRMFFGFSVRGIPLLFL